MGKLETLVRAEALLDKDTPHNKVCKEVIEFADNNKFPISLLMYIGVSTLAHKIPVFEKGYKKFNHEKATAVLALAEMFANYFGQPKYRTNDKVVHTCARYYDLQGGSTSRFANILKSKDKQVFNIKNFKTAKELGMYLFQDFSEFTDRGYLKKTLVAKMS